MVIILYDNKFNLLYNKNKYKYIIVFKYIKLDLFGTKVLCTFLE